jgi:hypothetical protein
MLRTRGLLLSFAILGSALVATRGDDDPKAPASAPDVAVKLTISVDEYDPSTPSKGIVKCVVVNNGKEPLQVTLGYDARTNVLLGGEWPWLTLYPPQRSPAEPKTNKVEPKTAKVEPKTAKVESKAEQTVFELSLDEILQGGWRWDWSARPPPPPSPIHQMDGRRFVAQAEFWAEVLIGGKPHVSDKVLLKVKPPLHPHR